MTTLGSLDSNEIGRYDETTPIGSGGTPTFSQYLNASLESVSAAFTKYVRRETVFKRTTGTHATGSGFSNITLATAVVGSDFTRSAAVYTCVTPGEYRITLLLDFAANATGNRGARLLASGSIGDRSVILGNAGGTFGQSMFVQWIVTLAAGDTITTQAYQNSGSSLTTLGSVTFERIP